MVGPLKDRWTVSAGWKHDGRGRLALAHERHNLVPTDHRNVGGDNENCLMASPFQSGRDRSQRTLSRPFISDPFESEAADPNCVTAHDEDFIGPRFGQSLGQSVYERPPIDFDECLVCAHAPTRPSGHNHPRKGW